MNLLGKQLLSYFLLLCLVVTAIPVNLLHHHEEMVYREIAGACHEADLCHTADLHEYGIQLPACDHKAHFDEHHKPCELCKFKTANRDKYLSNFSYLHIPSQGSDTISVSGRIFPASDLSGVIFSRGPPA